MTRWLRSFGAFWYDFVIGDDWRGAAVVVLALALTAVLVHGARPERLVAAAGRHDRRPGLVPAPRRQQALIGQRGTGRATGQQGAYWLPAGVRPNVIR